MRRHITLVVIAFFMLLPSKCATSADYRFSGTVTSVPEPILFLSEIAVGDTLSGRVTLTLRSVQVDSARTYYDVSNFSADIGGHYALSSTGGDFFIANNLTGVLDVVQLDIANPPHLMGPNISGYVPAWFEIALPYPRHYLTSTELLPEFPPSPLGNPSYVSFRFNNGPHRDVNLAINSFYMVPEPVAILTALCGILFLSCQREVGHCW